MLDLSWACRSSFRAKPASLSVSRRWITATASEDVEEDEEEADQQAEAEEEAVEEETVEVETAADEIQRTGDYLDAVEAARSWAREAVVLAGIVSKQKKKQTDAEYQTVIEAEANKLIKRVTAEVR